MLILQNSATSPSTFQYELFVKNNAAKRYEKLGEEFQTYSENRSPTIISNKDVFTCIISLSQSSQFITDQLVIRGNYSTISICVYGIDPPKEETKQIQPTLML